ncbi:MAG: translation initiation factor IF-2 [Candidatus Brocadiia bacterium]
MRIRVWQVISELKEETTVVLERCKELNLRAFGRFSLLTERESEQLKEAVARFRRDEIDKKKASRVVRFAPGFSPEERKQKEDEEKRRKAAAKAAPKSEAKPAAVPGREEKDGAKRKEAPRDEKKPKETRTQGRKRSDDTPPIVVEEPDYTGMAALPGLHRMSRGSSKAPKKNVIPIGHLSIVVPISVRDLSQALGIKANDIILKSMKAGKMVNLNTMFSGDDVEMIAMEFGRDVEVKKPVAASEVIDRMDEKRAEGTQSPKSNRAPVVTFMGHVDHGKTSLLDHIRETNVASKEAGGITQHIGAYRVDREDLHITFLDTPGHEAFTALRARGAILTDIVILVVAADDGVMPQTIEAISHAKAANVPIIVAINKMDKPSADPMKVKQQLMKYDLVPEEWGGTTICVNVSAVSGEGVNTLLEMITLVAEMLELQASPELPARGTVIEARKNEKMGAVATVLVQDGMLRIGDNLVVGRAYCRVRNIKDWRGHTLDEAGPSFPVEVSGLSEVPTAGDKFNAVESIDVARKIAEERVEEDRFKSASERKPMSLEAFLKGASSEKKDLPLIVKCDVSGSKEVLESTLQKLSTSKAEVKLVYTGVGGINLADVQLADASKAIIIGFNVVPEAKARQLAEQLKVEIRTYNIIYDLLNEIKNALTGLLEPIRKEVVTARVEIRNIFKISKVGTIAGCSVREGTISRSDSIRLTRNNVVIFSGALDSLKRFKDDAREVREGFECGLKIAGYDDIKEGDILESFRIELIQPTLDSD